ncbi:PKD domain-containing protein [Autumnicola musiva]|uniref:PKD domain-containing protein n=1 Tax=Autumnicola musiva TaxID=3075589 RepID=A0ABU3DAL4_9FLAO|nr:PKD domain-containing protein [Zunongwangia sp. F117]MDT0678563.1 PKD domain-containing protein [Zunongwangia sp. F117]
MKKNKYITFLSMLVLILSVSCSTEEDTSSDTKAVFSYVTDGFLVNFTNFSRNAEEYQWDFDDNGATSDRSNPAHVFPAKGEYLVSLTAIRGDQTSTFVDTVRITGPNIKIDGDFTDWEHVEYNFENPEGSEGSLLKIKTFASGDALNFYIEGTPDMNLAVMNFYFDTDNNPDTGHLSWMFPAASGAEIMGEGFYNSDDPAASSGNVSEYAGPGGGDWTWNTMASFAETVNFSEFDTNDGNKVIEFSISRDILGEDVGDVVNFALTESDSGYTQIGAVPAFSTPESAFIPIEL